MPSRPSLRDAPLPPRVRRDPVEVFGGPMPSTQPAAPEVPDLSQKTPHAPPQLPRQGPSRSAPVQPVKTTLVRPRYIPKPRARRADGRATRTIEIHPVLIGLLDEAAELIADRLGWRLDRSAYYEALLAVALRRSEEVQAILAADPDGVAITANLVRDLEARGGILPSASLDEPIPDHGSYSRSES